MSGGTLIVKLYCVRLIGLCVRACVLHRKSVSHAKCVRVERFVIHDIGWSNPLFSANHVTMYATHYVLRIVTRFTDVLCSCRQMRQNSNDTYTLQGWWHKGAVAPNCLGGVALPLLRIACTVARSKTIINTGPWHVLKSGIYQPWARHYVTTSNYIKTSQFKIAWLHGLNVTPFKKRFHTKRECVWQDLLHSITCCIT